MAISSLEKLLDSCYPVTSTLLGFLTAWDLACLKQVSKSCHAIVDRTPVIELSFLPHSVSNHTWDFYVEHFGYSGARVIYVGKEYLARAPLDDYSCARRLSDERIWKSLSSLTETQIGGLRELYLDATSVGDDLVRDILLDARFSELRVLSLAGCSQISLKGLMATFDHIVMTKGRPKIRRLKVWGTRDVQALVQDMNNMYSLFSRRAVRLDKEIVAAFRAIMLLGMFYGIDTIICTNHDKNPFIPAHIQRKACAKCKKVEFSIDCPTCLIKRTCEVCNGYYCEECKPWVDDGQQYTVPPKTADVASDSARIEGYLGKDEHEVAISECCSEKICFGHMGQHRYHKRCSTRLPDRVSCKYCLGEPCRWQNSYTRCGHCDEIICNDCSDAGNTMECEVCETRYCDNFESYECTSSFRFCSGWRCHFSMCGKCVEAKRSPGFPRGYCEGCEPDAEDSSEEDSNLSEFRASQGSDSDEEKEGADGSDASTNEECDPAARNEEDSESSGQYSTADEGESENINSAMHI